MDAREAGGELLKQEASFVLEFFQTAEHEARATERYVLIALGAIYSYLAAQKGELPPGAWYAPTFVVVVAFIRAVGLGYRQKQLLKYLQEMEGRLTLPSGVSGWAEWFSKLPPFIAISAGAFYVLLIVVTLVVALIA